MTPEELEAHLEQTRQWATWAKSTTGDVRNGRAIRTFIAADAAVTPKDPYVIDPVSDYDDAKGGKLADQARRGDYDAKAALCNIASAHIRRRRRLPPNLGDYVLGLLSEHIFHQKKQGYANAMRDWTIVSQIKKLVQLGVQPTRNRAAFDKPPYSSACAMVAHVLNLAEKAVQDIWDDRASVDQGHRRKRR